MPCSHADPAIVASAANFRSTLVDLIDAYQTRHPEADYEVISGSTGILYAQIQAGAPFDLFFAADEASTEELAQAGRSIKPPEIYAIGRLALWAPNNQRPWQDFLRSFNGRIALANPLLAPYGRAAAATLKAGFFSQTLKTVQGNNVVQAFQFVETGNVEAGLLSLAQLRLAQVSPNHFYLVPTKYHPPIIQKRVLLTNHAAAIGLDQFVSTSVAQQILTNAGYQTQRPNRPLK